MKEGQEVCSFIHAVMYSSEMGRVRNLSTSTRQTPELGAEQRQSSSLTILISRIASLHRGLHSHCTSRTSIRFVSVAMAAQVGTALHAQQPCQLASFQGLRLTSARVQQQQQQPRSQVSFARRCLAAVRANSPSAGGATGDAGAAASSSTVNKSSILCQNCDGNGAVACSQCNGGGLNTEDHFNGRFKAGTTCWLCRGKRQMLCGNCNGAGFMGGFMNTQDE